MVSFNEVYEAIQGSLSLSDQVIDEHTPLKGLDENVEFTDLLDIFHRVGRSSKVGEYVQEGSLTDLGRGVLIGYVAANHEDPIKYIEQLESGEEAYVGNFTPRDIKYLAEKMLGA